MTNTKERTYWTGLAEEALASKSERNDLDFKSSLSDDESRWKEHINAMGNTRGGGAFAFGVKRDFSFVDTPLNHQAITDQLRNFATDAQSPPLRITTFTANVRDRELFFVHVHEGTTLPVFIKDRSPFGGQGCFKRSGNSTIPMTDDEIRDQLSRSRAVGIDESIVPDISLANLNLKRLAETYSGFVAAEGASAGNISVLQDNGILVANGANPEVTLAGFLVYGLDTQSHRQFRNASIEFQLFRGTTRADPIKKSTLYGSLPEQIDAASELCLQHVWSMPQIRGSRREELPAYDAVRLREVLTNALAHRDYTKMHQPVKIGVFTDRMEIENPGSLMPGLTIYNLVNKRAWRNPRIARMLDQCGYGEMDGQGIDRLYEGTLRIRLPAPRFIADQYSFKVILSGPKHYDELTPEERRLTVMILLVLERSVDNEAIRTVFNIEASQAGTLLKAMVADGIICPMGARKFTRYSLSPQYQQKFYE